MKKGSRSYVLVIFAFIALFGLIATTQAHAENKIAGFFKNIVKWPFSITKKSVETVGRTTEKAATTAISTTGSAVETVTGKPEKIKDVVVEPIKGSAETVYTAAEGAVKAPIEGTEEAFETEESQE